MTTRCSTTAQSSQKTLQQYKSNRSFIRLRKRYPQQFLLNINSSWINRTRTPNHSKAHRLSRTSGCVTAYVKLPPYGRVISGSKHTIPPIKFNRKNTLKELTKKERPHFRNFIIRQPTEKDLILELLNTHSLTSTRKGEKNFDLHHLMNDKKFDHIVLANTRRHLPYLPKYGIIS